MGACAAKSVATYTRTRLVYTSMFKTKATILTTSRSSEIVFLILESAWTAAESVIAKKPSLNT